MPTNRLTIGLIVGTISLLATIAVSTIAFCSFKGIEIPPELNTLAGGLVGALGSMLVKTSPSEGTKSASPTPNGDEPTEVKVVNEPADPVKTEEIKP